MRIAYLRSFVVLLAVALLLGVAAPAVAGNVATSRPFHGVYIGLGDPGEPTITCEEGFPSAGAGIGHANHLGDYTWRAEFCMEFIDPTHVKAHGGRVTVVAANGDLLYGLMEAEGEFLPDGTMVNSQSMTYEGGTGRFARAQGNATAVGVISPDGSSYNAFEGVLAFDASDRSR